MIFGIQVPLRVFMLSPTRNPKSAVKEPLSIHSDASNKRTWAGVKVSVVALASHTIILPPVKSRETRTTMMSVGRK